MARVSIKATYALDVASVRALEKMAQRWEVSKSEALRRAIHAAAAVQLRDVKHGLGALDRLQRSLALTPAQAKEWAGKVRAERRASRPSRATRERR